MSAAAVWRFYRDGFRSMTVGRTLWCLILIKLFVIFVILRLFFFQPHMEGKDNAQRQDYVGSELLRRSAATHPDNPE